MGTHFSTASLFETTNHQTHKMAKGSGSKKAKKSGSNVFALFSQRQIQEFKEASVSWTQTRTVSCLPQTLSQLSALSANPSPTVRPKACSQRPPDPSTSHRWSCF